ncbi:MAG TPA: zinc ribbon domain-containing protein [Methanomassiliicoccales archaeon]|jgi:rRNA maturation endonuclease Nob1
MSLFNKDQGTACPGCGNRIQPTDRFCKYCGRAAAQAAPSPTPSSDQKMRQCTGCGREVPEGLNFCPFCGKPTPGAAPAEAAPAVQSASIQPQPVQMPQSAPGLIPQAPAPAQNPMPRCVGCNREIPEGLKFCPYCARPNPYAFSAPAAPEPPYASQAAAPQSMAQSSGMEKCTACGKEIPSGLKYCPYCGRLASVEQPVQKQAPAPSPMAPPQGPAPLPQPTPLPEPTPMPTPVAPTSTQSTSVPSTAPVIQSATKRCVGCGREINSAMKFCPFCGTADSAPTQAPPSPPGGTRICPGCGKEISITHDFCPACGYPKNPRFY